MCIETLEDQMADLFAPALADPAATRPSTSCCGRIWSTISSIGNVISALGAAILTSLGSFFQSVVPTAVQDTVQPATDDPITREFGFGIYNGRNTCYLNSVLQGLRATDVYRDCLASDNGSDAVKNVRNKVNSLFINLEGNAVSSVAPRPITREEICTFREQMRQASIDIPAIEQGDAAEFCESLLDKCDVPAFDITHQARDHARQAGIRVVELLAAGASEGTPLATLAQNSFTLNGPNPPRLLPLHLLRVSDDGRSRITTSIPPSEHIEIALTSNPSQKARYKLCSMVVHQGSHVSGHYYTYMPAKYQGRPVWVEYNDAKVHLYNDPTTETRRRWCFGNITIQNDACQNGRIFFYELVDATAPPLAEQQHQNNTSHANIVPPTPEQQQQNNTSHASIAPQPQ